MGFESRPGTKKRFYYRSVRIDGQVRKEYVGPADDPAVQIIARQDELLRMEQTADLQEARRVQADFKQLEPLIAALEKQVISGLEAGSYASFPFPVTTETFEMNTVHKQPDPAGDRTPDETTKEQFEHLVSQARRGDQDAAEELQRIIRSRKDIWQPVGDLAKHAEELLISQIAQDNLVLGESLRLQLAQMKESLGRDADDPVIALLVDLVVVTWLELHLVRMEAGQSWRFVRDARFWEQRHEHAAQRHLVALRKLHEWRDQEGNDDETMPFELG